MDKDIRQFIFKFLGITIEEDGSFNKLKYNFFNDRPGVDTARRFTHIKNR